MRRLANSRRAKDPENYLPESSAVMDLMDLKEGFECILGKFKGPDLSKDNVKIGCKWESDHEDESDFESKGTKELLKDISDSISETSISEFPEDDKILSDFCIQSFKEKPKIANRQKCWNCGSTGVPIK